MTEDSCKHHGLIDHRVKACEKDIEINAKRIDMIEKKQRDPRIWVAVFAFCGVAFSTLGSLAGIFLHYYLTGRPT